MAYTKDAQSTCQNGFQIWHIEFRTIGAQTDSISLLIRLLSHFALRKVGLMPLYSARQVRGDSERQRLMAA